MLVDTISVFYMKHNALFVAVTISLSIGETAAVTKCIQNVQNEIINTYTPLTKLSNLGVT